MKSQKQAVVDEVAKTLGNSFVFGKDVALSLLSTFDIDRICDSITDSICAGHVTYSKPTTIKRNVRIYVKSMVMNHLKRASSLNGGMRKKALTSKHVPRSASQPLPKGIDLNILPDYLVDLAVSLVK